MRFGELHRTVLQHCARSETTIKYFAPLAPIITIRGGWVKPFPSHPDVLNRYSSTQEETNGCIHLIKWHQMPIRVDIPALLEQVLGRLWGVENNNNLIENLDGHNLACTLPRSALCVWGQWNIPYCRPHSVNVSQTKFFGKVRKWPMSGNPRGPGGWGSWYLLRREPKAETKTKKTRTAKTSERVILDKCMSCRETR